MAELPTWNAQPVTQENVIDVAREAFDVVLEHMTSSGRVLSKDEHLHLLEAGSYLYWMGGYATSLALTSSRDAGASWGEMGAAMGISRSSVKSRYEREARGTDDR